MAAVKGSRLNVAAYGVAHRYRIPEKPTAWQRTPWWQFWRPKWRRIVRAGWTTLNGVQSEGRYEFASDQTRARQALEESCCPTGPGADGPTSPRRPPFQTGLAR